MNCDEYRQAVTADPSFEGGGEHVARCGDCQAYRQELHALDRRIERALAIRVPEIEIPDLPEIETGNVSRLVGKRRLSAPAWFGLAATVTLAAFLGVRMLGTGASDATLAEQILDHLDHERGSLVVTDRAVSDERLARVVPARIANLGHDAGLVTYAQSCKINGMEVPHLVLQGERGPVTILLMPGQPVDSVQSIAGESVEGVIIPIGEGSIAIIGEGGEDLGPIRQNVTNSVTWDT